MRIAIFLESLQGTGGGFHQALSTVESLTSKRSTKHDFFVFTPFEQTRHLLSKQGIDAIQFKQGVFRSIDRWSATVVGYAFLRRLRRLGFKRLGRHLDALLDDYDIDLVILNECTDAVLRIGAHPIIVTVWDLDHRDHPEFAEAYLDRTFERRERFLGITLRRAVAVIANSSY